MPLNMECILSTNNLIRLKERQYGLKLATSSVSANHIPNVLIQICYLDSSVCLSESWHYMCRDTFCYGHRMFPFLLLLGVTKRPLSGFSNILDTERNDKLATVSPFSSYFSQYVPCFR